MNCLEATVADLAGLDWEASKLKCREGWQPLSESAVLGKIQNERGVR